MPKPGPSPAQRTSSPISPARTRHANGSSAPPGIFTKQTRRMFGEAAGFEAREIETTGGVWRIDMIKCPYHDACVHYGCPELCPCFCDSDDITYDDLHPDLLWRRTRTLGRGNDCCDFCLKLR
ncbi:MAG: L-2-amino-thiazoline-4-carboxylic acid hydrolase [Oscillospiraceae bacterium]